MIILLDKLGIKSIKKIVKGGKMFRIFLYGKDNLKKFEKEIGFLHPDKKRKLKKAIEDYVNYVWQFPKEENKSKRFLRKILKEKLMVRKPRSSRIISKEESNLLQVQKLLKKFYNIHSRVNKSVNGTGTIYYELNIHRKEDIVKLIKLKMIKF